jgi:hypothetical protein
MAKAVIPYRAFTEKFAVADAQTIAARLQEIVAEFLHDGQKDVKALRADAKNEREELKVRS